MKPNTCSPTPELLNIEYSQKARFLARYVLTRYPGKFGRQSFYHRYYKFHGQIALDTLISDINREYTSFLGWCALSSRVSSHVALLNYLEESQALILAHSHANYLPGNQPAPIIQGDIFTSPSNDTRAFYDDVPACPPWWSELPHLAPKGVNHA